MFARLTRNSLIKRIIAVAIIMHFAATSIVVKGYAAASNLRPPAAKNDSGREEDIKKELEFNHIRDIPKAERLFPKYETGEKPVDLFKAFIGEYDVFSTKDGISEIDDLAYGSFIKKEIDFGKSVQVRKGLEEYFGEIKTGDKFYTLTYTGIPVALVKKGSSGAPVVKAIVDNITDIPASIFAINEEHPERDVEAMKKSGTTVVDIILRDYLILEKRSLIPILERNVIEFKELRDYVYDLAGKVGMEKAKEIASVVTLGGKEAVDKALLEIPKEAKQAGKERAKEIGLSLAGGKGLSLSVMSRLVLVPPGQNVTTTAYFKFIKGNEYVWKKIFTELQDLDTMDDQKRFQVSKEIREAIEASIMPEDIKYEILAMYHQLSMKRWAITGKAVPAAVAVRSSGTKEDIKVTTWLDVSTGSQAGQSDTFLNVKGDMNVLVKTRADFASLFTDRAVSYRDDATFLLFTAVIHYKGKDRKLVYWDIVAKLREYSKKHPEYAIYADTMSKITSPNPGSVNLMKALEEILKQENNPELRFALDVLKEKSQEVVHPDQIGIDVVIMQMVNSYLSGVLFTVNPATKNAGVALALYKAWYMNDNSLVYKDEKTGVIQGTKPIVVSFDVAFGYGENVVGGKVNPDKYIMGTYDEKGKNWFVIEKRKGNKLIQMKNVEDVTDLLKNKMTPDNQVAIAGEVKDAIAYDEAGKRINGLLVTKLSGTKYLKILEGKEKESEKEKKTRVQDIANEIADIIGLTDSEEKVIEFIKKNYDVVHQKHFKGIQEKDLSVVVDEVFKEMRDAQNDTEKGKQNLAKRLGDRQKAEVFISMTKEVWENKKDLEMKPADRQAVLDKLNFTDQEQRNFSYYIRARADKSFTANYETTKAHQNVFTMTDEQAKYIARMGWAIAAYYKDTRDVEFAIEIDKTASSDDDLKLYVVDDHGNFRGMDEEGNLVIVKTEADRARIKPASLRLYNVQARPYTAEYLKTDVIRSRTEADEKWMEENSPTPIARGTKGENATHGYVISFVTDKDVAWHADLIRRLKAGDFTPEERKRIADLGFNPDDYGAGKEKQLPIILYLLEADPNHDPIMRLVDSVVTKRGGDTCHAAIFCREQGIPAVTGAGEVFLRGQLVKTGDALTVDANNGNIYAMDADKDKRIPINFEKLKIKPYAIPGDDDNMPYPKIGQIIAATGAAQNNSPIMLAVDSAGNSLTRAEFKGEEIGINVYAGYGYDLIQKIKAEEMKKPVRIYADDLSRMKGAEKFYMSLSGEIAQYMEKHPAAKKVFVETFSKDPGVEDGSILLTAFDLKTDLALNKIQVADLFPAQERVLRFLDKLDKSDKDFFSYAYGKFQRRYNYNYNIVTDLENHPWILDEVQSKLAEKGYASFKDYLAEEFLSFYNLMGFTIAPDQTAKNRAYDFAQDKIRGMPGSEIFSWPGVNPLVGLRGTSLEIETFDEEFGGNQLVLDFLFDSVIQAHQNTDNQAWFYVFVRSVRELDTLDKIIELKAEQKGKLPKELGIMIEVPSTALIADQLAEKMSAMNKKYAKYGVKHNFFSFGTNDFSHLAGMGDREDPRMKLKIEDSAAKNAIAEMVKAGYYYDVKTERLPLIDEGADVMLQLIEAVVAPANKWHVDTSLCGEAITALVNRKDYEAAGKIMVLLDSFGVSMMKVRLPASMTRYDVMAATKEITVPEANRKVLVDLAPGKVLQPKGVIKGEIVYVDNAEDLVPDSLKKLNLAELTEKKDFLKMQSRAIAQSTVRTHEKIVVISRNPVTFSREEAVAAVGENAFEYATHFMERLGNGLYIWTNLNIPEKRFKEELEASRLTKDEQTAVLGLWKKAWDNSIEGLERRGIDWDDLQYAKAIIVDQDVDLKGWDVFNAGKSINPTRIKAEVKGIGSKRKQLEGAVVTIDYAAQKIYEGRLAVKKIQNPLRRLPIPETRPQVEVKAAVAEDANNVYRNMVYHPKILLAYEMKDWTEPGKIFDEYVAKLKEEVEKVTQEQNAQKRASLLAKLENKVEGLSEPVIKEFMLKVVAEAAQKGEVSLPDGWNTTLREQYFAELNNGIAKLLGKQTAEQFITAAFRDSMEKAISDNSGSFVVHKTTSLNCVEFNNLRGGFLVEQVNPNPDYGILGAARAIGDMWRINRMELAAFKAVREAQSAEQRKNFGLQITNLKGTQSGAVMIGWAAILKDMDIIPGRGGLEVGVNIATPSDTLALDKYLEYFKGLGQGLSFISYDQIKLGAAWAGVDIYWSEWRRLAQEEELQKFGQTAASIVEAKLEAANKADPSVNRKVVTFEAGITARSNDGGKSSETVGNLKRTEISPELVKQLKVSDEAVYNALSKGFGNFVNSLKGLESGTGSLLIGANTVFENAGTLTALKKIKDAQPGLQIAFWAKDKAEAEKLKSVVSDTIADSVSYESLSEALKSLKEFHVINERIVIVNSDLDNKNIKEEFQVKEMSEFLAKPEVKGVRIMAVHEASTFAGGESINDMPLVLARATAAVSQDEKVVKQYEKFSQNSGLSEDTLKALNDLDQEFVTVPLVKVSDEVAKAQVTYTETMNKI